MGKIYTSGSPISKVYEVGVNAPFDTRLTVQNVADLTDGENGGIATQVYRGMTVYVHQDKSLYVYSGASNSTWKNKSNGKLINGGDINNWKKIYGEEFDPADYLSYYREKLSAKVLNSADGLVGILEPFEGQFAYVKDDPNTSEDESGLYIYTGQAWKRIFTGNSSSGTSDYSQVITTDGTVPESGTGLSIVGNDPNADIEETFADDYLHAGVYYTTEGLNSSRGNGGNELVGVEKIRLSNNGDSYIELTDDGNMTIHIEDNTLGFDAGDISIIDENGVESEHPYEGSELPLTITDIPLGAGALIRFDVDVDFTGMTETRDDDPDEFIFGNTGSNYNDLDFYSVRVLPTIYAYINGEPTRIMTEGNTIQKISDQEIEDLF